MKVMLAIFLLLCPAALSAKGDDIVVSVCAQRAWHYAVRGEFSVEISPDVVWRVLSDYENIPTFVRSVKESKLEKKNGNSRLLRQKFKEGFWWVARQMNVLLEIQETPRAAIEFTDILQEDFNFYKGSWKIEEEARGARVVYDLEIGGNFSLPAFVTRSFLKRNARELLGQVRREILARGGN